MENAKHDKYGTPYESSYTAVLARKSQAWLFGKKVN